MRNICLTIAYVGTGYAGWQIQENAKTIQGEIEKALRNILGERVKLVAAGRTDSGVHAKAQTASFRTTKDIPTQKLQIALNSKLPKTMSIIGATEVPIKYHAQFNAKSKVYRYVLLNSRIDDPFLRDYYYKVPYRLNVSLMRREASILEGRHDFKSFQSKSASSTIKSTVRTIKKVSVKRYKQFIYIDLEADGFLYNMVRNIAGTLIEIGRGYLPAGSLETILKSRKRTKTVPTAPAKGLTLMKVRY